MPSLLGNIRFNPYYQRVSLVYKRPEVKTSVELLLSVFVVMILIMMAIRPTLSNIAVLQKKIEDQTAVIKKADNKITELTDVQNKLSENADLLTLLDSAVSSSTNYFEPIKRIEILAQEKNITLESVKAPSKTVFGSVQKLPVAKRDRLKTAVAETTGTLLKIPYQLSFVGDQAAVFSMIKDMENMDFVASIDEISIRKTTEKNQATRLRGSMKITFYSVLEKTQ